MRGFWRICVLEIEGSGVSLSHLGSPTVVGPLCALANSSVHEAFDHLGKTQEALFIGDGEISTHGHQLLKDSQGDCCGVDGRGGDDGQNRFCPCDLLSGSRLAESSPPSLFKLQSVPGFESFFYSFLRRAERACWLINLVMLPPMIKSSSAAQESYYDTKRYMRDTGRS